VTGQKPGHELGEHTSQHCEGLLQAVLGNLALLSTPVNTVIRNDSFADKKPLLKAAVFNLTKSIAQLQDWEPAEIDAVRKSWRLLRSQHGRFDIDLSAVC
jgi:Protein of unknown function (DUF1524)